MTINSAKQQFEINLSNAIDAAFMYPGLCPGCSCKKVWSDQHIPGELLTFNQTYCIYCKGWSIAPIPPIELGIDLFPAYEYKHDY